MPGLTIAIATSELAAQNFVAGLSRMIGLCVGENFMSMFVGSTGCESVRGMLVLCERMGCVCVFRGGMVLLGAYVDWFH